MTKKLPSYQKRVEDGAKLLDEKVPGWYKRIDVGKLELDCPSNCILGQVYAIANNRRSIDGFMKVCGQIFECDEHLILLSDLDELHGFNLVEREKGHWTWKKLQSLWIEQIHLRLAKDRGQELSKETQLAGTVSE